MNRKKTKFGKATVIAWCFVGSMSLVAMKNNVDLLSIEEMKNSSGVYDDLVKDELVARVELQKKRIDELIVERNKLMLGKEEYRVEIVKLAKMMREQNNTFIYKITSLRSVCFVFLAALGVAGTFLGRCESMQPGGLQDTIYEHLFGE